MARSAASIQSEIDRLETFLASTDSLFQSVGADGTNAAHINRQQAEQRLDKLYQHLARANRTSPMFVRGQVTGLRGR